MDEFRNELIGVQFREIDRYWHDLVSDYHRVTELYDQVVCGSDGIPKTSGQRRLVTEHAIHVMGALKTQACITRKLTAKEVDAAWTTAKRNYNSGPIKSKGE